MDRRQYKSPPITEALCAFYFAPAGEWDIMYPALIYGKVKDEYSGKAREQKLINIEPASKEIQAPAGAPMAVNEVTRIQFVTKDEKKVLGVYADNLSISVLKPYPGWEVFRPAIQSGLDVYREIAKPKGLRRIGLRYLNQVTIDGQVSDVLSCFSSPPLPLTGGNSHIENFTSRHEYLCDDEPLKVTVGFARLAAPAGKVAVLLDIDLVWQSQGDPLSLDQAMAKVDDMRQRERVIFESLITDRARQIFDA